LRGVGIEISKRPWGSASDILLVETWRQRVSGLVHHAHAHLQITAAPPAL
jgi:hypothetical protein